MQSISVSNYRAACSELILEAIERPSMYYQSLADFEMFLFGHQAAFQQIASIDQSELFNTQFSEWLWNVHRMSCSSGWALAIEKHCSVNNSTPVNQFNEYASDFLNSWSKI